MNAPSSSIATTTVEAAAAAVVLATERWIVEKKKNHDDEIIFFARQYQIHYIKLNLVQFISAHFHPMKTMSQPPCFDMEY